MQGLAFGQLCGTTADALFELDVELLQRLLGTQMVGDFLLQRFILPLQVLLQPVEGQMGFHPNPDFFDTKRFVDVIDGTGLETFDLGQFIFQGADEDHGNGPHGRIGFESPADFKSVHAGHFDIQQDDIRRLDVDRA